jgi:hypothetical protein
MSSHPHRTNRYITAGPTIPVNSSDSRRAMTLHCGDAAMRHVDDLALELWREGDGSRSARSRRALARGLAMPAAPLTLPCARSTTAVSPRVLGS